MTQEVKNSLGLVYGWVRFLSELKSVKEITECFFSRKMKNEFDAENASNRKFFWSRIETSRPYQQRCENWCTAKYQFKEGSYKNNHFVRLLGRTRKKLYGRTSVCAPLLTRMKTRIPSCEIGFIDVGDTCWRRNVLATILICILTLASGTNFQKMSPRS